MESKRGNRPNSPLGIKLVAACTGFLAFACISAGVILCIKYRELHAAGQPGWIVIIFEFVVAAILIFSLRGLLFLRRWALRVLLITYGLMALMFVVATIQNQALPSMQKGWSFYLFLVPLGYLLRPSIRKQFK